MIADEQRRLPRQFVPTRRLEPEVVLIQGVPDGLLRAHQRLVGAVEGVFGSRGDALTDEGLDWALGMAARPPRPPLGAWWLDHGYRIVVRPGVPGSPHSGRSAVAFVLR